MKIVDVIAFVILLMGGINYLIAGVFGIDVMQMIFGNPLSIVGRIVYAVIGLSALLLVVTIIARALMKNKA